MAEKCIVDIQLKIVKFSISFKANIPFNGEEVTNIIEQIESGRLERSFKKNRHDIKHVREIIEEKFGI